VWYFEEAVNLASILHPTLSGNSDLALAHEWLGRCYIVASKLPQAHLHFEKTLEIRHDLYGEDHLEIGHSYHGLGNVYSAMH
jgi:hypothetical protein